MIRTQLFLIVACLLVLACKDRRPASTQAEEPSASHKADVDSTHSVQPTKGQLDASPSAKPIKGQLDASPSAKPLSRPDVKLTIANWLTAQNRGDFKAYAYLYASDFRGVRRSGEKEVTLDLAGWKKDRKRMFRKPMKVEIAGLEVAWTGEIAQADFVQIWRSGSYEDVGPKRIRLAIYDGKLRIKSEEMLWSGITPDGELTADDGEENYEDSAKFSGHFTSTKGEQSVVLRLIEGEESSASNEAMEDGFITQEWCTEIVLDKGGTFKKWPMSCWDDGWEWGTEMQLEGTMTLGTSGLDAVWIKKSSYSEGHGLEAKTEDLTLWQLGEGDPKELWTINANEIKVDAKKLGASVTAITSLSNRPWTDASDDDQEFEVRYKVRYKNGKVHAKEVQ